jgi:hypothetical protein
MNVYFTATPEPYVQNTIAALQAHGHTIVSNPMGPFTEVSLLRTDPKVGPQLVASAGASANPWFVVVSQTP